MNVRRTALLILIMCIVIAAVLFLSRQEPIWSYPAILSGLVQLAGFSIRDIWQKRRHVSVTGKIQLKRIYREGPIKQEEVTFSGPAVEKYVDGMSKLLADRSTPVSGDVAQTVGLMKEEKYDEADVKAIGAIKAIESSKVKKQTLELSQYYLIRGDAAFNTGRFADAEKFYNISHELAIEVKDDFLMMASSHGIATTKGSQGNHAEALAMFEQILRSHTNNANVWSNKGVALGFLGRYEEELKAYDEAIRLDPKYANAWCNKGAALESLGKHEEALKAFDEAIRLDPKYAW